MVLSRARCRLRLGGGALPAFLPQPTLSPFRTVIIYTLHDMLTALYDKRDHHLPLVNYLELFRKVMLTDPYSVFSISVVGLTAA